MKELDETARKNQTYWDRNVAQGDPNTIPCLDLDAGAYRDYAAGRSASWPCMQFEEAPEGILLKNARDKDVLCLARAF